LLRSEDGGATWAQVTGGLPPSTNGLAVVDDRTLFLSTSTEGVFGSADGGWTWSNANGFVTSALPTGNIRGIVYDPNSGDSYVGPSGERFVGALYVATDRGVFRSTDGGGSWDRLSFRTSALAVAVGPADSRILYVVDDRGQVFKSTDKGVTWRGG
jgi:photosystem II stability/assembly factor-like uncharacterized protein